MHPLKYANVKPGIDIIGDTHGRYDETKALLTKLGYKKKKGVFHHEGERRALFAGDKLDRGPKIRQQVNQQKKMLSSGSSIETMGNHEYNLRCMYISTLEKPDGLRARSEFNMKETEQTHVQYLGRKNGQREFEKMLADIYQIPLYYENAEFRVAHACWNPVNIAVLDEQLKDKRITPDQMIHVETQWKKTPLSKAVIETLKGPEIKTKKLLDLGLTEEDLKGTRKSQRVAWWHQNIDDMTEVALGDVILELPHKIRDKKIPFEFIKPYLVEDPDPRPVFFGHYCLEETPPHLMGPKYQCLDFGVIKPHGFLTAYQWNFGDTELKSERLVSVPRLTL